MALAITTTFALTIWIVLWATGTKSNVGFLIATVVIMLGATVKIVAPYLPGRE